MLSINLIFGSGHRIQLGWKDGSHPAQGSASAPANAPLAWSAPVLQAATPGIDGRASGHRDFSIFYRGKISGVLRAPGPGSNTQSGTSWGAGMALQEEPAGNPPDPTSPEPTKPLMNPTHQKPSPGLSPGFLLFIYLSVPAFLPLPITWQEHLMEPTPLGTAAGPHWESGGASHPDLPGARGKSRLAAAATVPTRGP